MYIGPILRPYTCRFGNIVIVVSAHICFLITINCYEFKAHLKFADAKDEEHPFFASIKT